MELSCNNIVRLKNGFVGAVTCFNGKPTVIAFKNYANPVSNYDGELNKKNSKGTDYDIEEVYDGSSVEDMGSVYSKRFNLSELPSIWKRGEQQT